MAQFLLVAVTMKLVAARSPWPRRLEFGMVTGIKQDRATASPQGLKETETAKQCNRLLPYAPNPSKPFFRGLQTGSVAKQFLGGATQTRVLPRTSTAFAII